MNPNSMVFWFIDNVEAALGARGRRGGGVGWGRGGEVMWQHSQIKSDSHCEENGA